MPNWCECDLWVIGKPAERERFQEFAREDPNVLSASRFIPYPEKFRLMDEEYPRRQYIDPEDPPDTKREKEIYNLRLAAEWQAILDAYEAKWGSRKDGFNSGGYEWCIQNWGSKWGICRSKLVRRTRRSDFYRFESPWSPPLPVIEKMAEIFPQLEFRLKYYEGGAGYRGGCRFRRGELLEDSFQDYHGRRGG